MFSNIYKKFNEIKNKGVEINTEKQIWEAQ